MFIIQWVRSWISSPPSAITIRKEAPHLHPSGIGEIKFGNRTIPEELMIEILCHLPLKSLIRFSCVCKSWQHLIKYDHKFAIKHYTTRSACAASPYAKLMDNAHCFLTRYSRRGSGCMYSLTETKTLRCLKRFDLEPLELEMGIVGACHGIICFASSSIYSVERVILLCNPSIQEVVLVPQVPGRKRYFSLTKMSFGFDPTTNDYKIVKLDEPNIDRLGFWVAAVYSVRAGCWRNLPFLAPSLGAFQFLLDTPAVLNANGCISNWRAYKKNGQKGIISFDMVKEVLKEILVPECVVTSKQRGCCLLSSSKYQACLGCFSANCMDIWVLPLGEEAPNMWTRLLTLQFDEHEVLLHPLPVLFSDMTLLVELAKGSSCEVFHYDTSTQQLKRTGHIGELGICSEYGESLVSLRGLMLPEIWGKQYLQYTIYGVLFHNQSILFNREANANKIYSFRVVGRLGVQWSYRFKLLEY